MKDRLSSLLLMLFSAGMLAICATSCATPAVKKPDVNRPTQNQGSQTANTTNTSNTTKATTKSTTAKPLKKPGVNELNDSIVIVDSLGVRRVP